MSFDNDEQRQAHVEALRDERAHCVTYGKTDRVKAIDAELARVSGKDEKKKASSK